MDDHNIYLLVTLQLGSNHLQCQAKDKCKANHKVLLITYLCS